MESEVTAHGAFPCFWYDITDLGFVLDEYRCEERARRDATDGDGVPLSWKAPTKHRSKPSCLRTVEDAVLPLDLNSLGRRGTLLAPLGVKTRIAFFSRKKRGTALSPCTTACCTGCDATSPNPGHSCWSAVRRLSHGHRVLPWPCVWSVVVANANAPL